MTSPAFTAALPLRAQSSPLRRARCAAAPRHRAAPPRAAALDAPVKTDIGALERMFAMPSTERAPDTARFDPGKRAKVLLLNDAQNERSFVARVLAKVCPELGPEACWAIMDAAHKNGSAVVGIYPFEQGEMIVEQLRNNGLLADLEEA